MIGEWRATSGSASVDVYLWLEDSTGQEVVYPTTTVLEGWTSKGAYPEGSPQKQWVEREILADLEHGTTYEVCLSVLPAGSNKPSFQKPDVKGLQVRLTY